MTTPPAAPTQVQHPRRAVARTILAAIIGALSLLPEVLGQLHLDGTVLGAQAVAVAGAVTRVLAMPAVEGWLRRFAPWLAAQPKK